MCPLLRSRFASATLVQVNPANKGARTMLHDDLYPRLFRPFAMALLSFSTALFGNALAEVAPNASAAAYQAYGNWLECRETTERQCPVPDCKVIERQLDWVGALCLADQWQLEGKKRKFENEIEKAFALFSQANDDQRGGEYSSAAASRKPDRADALMTYLQMEAILEAHEIAFSQNQDSQLLALQQRAEAGDAVAQFDYAFKLYNDKSNPVARADAIQWYRRAADQGIAEAQFNLGFIYAKGQGVPNDDAQAVAWFRKAAEQGFALAQNQLGEAYFQGRGVAKDRVQAAAWFRKAADQGHAIAQASLGFMYGKGHGVAKDDAQAISWNRKAADQGLAIAQFNLGIIYAKGQGVPKDDAQAVAWHRKAADQGLALAQTQLALKYFDGHGVAKDDLQAVAWYRKAADQSDAVAQMELGLMYVHGLGVVKNDAQAVAWFRKAADQGLANAQIELGRMYVRGLGVAKDYEQAVAWFRKAVDQGLADAQFELGRMYANGRGVAKDDVQAVAWFRKAADQGDARAQNTMGTYFEDGRGGLLQDASGAAGWYRKAAMQGEKYAQRNLAQLYWNGLGVSETLITAYAWMNLAAAGGHENAPAERDQIAARLSGTELQKAQKLSREWKLGQVLPEMRATEKPSAATSIPSQAVQPATNHSRYPSRPAKVSGRVSCNTRCSNADCYRTYDDGKQTHFQAERRLNASGEWEWDSGSC